MSDTNPFDDYTIADYLRGISPLLSEEALQTILRKRNLAPNIPLEYLEQKDMDLAEAEVYYQLCNLPVGGSTIKDVDGSWSHTEGGWTISKANLEQWYKKYVDLRSLWGEYVMGKSKMRIINL